MQCRICGKEKSLKEFGRITPRSKTSICRLCSWYSRNSVNIVDGWSKEEYDIILDNILNEKIEFVNDLSAILNRSLDDIVNLLRNNLIIWNKKLKVKFICAYCGKEVVRHMKEYGKGNIFCDMKCRNDYKLKYAKHGKDNPSYNSKVCNCVGCGKEIVVPPNKYNQTNRFGDNHFFCSQQCCWNFRKKYYIGDKSNIAKYSKTPEGIEKSRRQAIINLQNNIFPQTLTKPHRIINELLHSLNIDYQNEYGCKYYSIDIYLPDKKLMIEIMGDYFHVNPNKYSDLSMTNDMQKKDIKRDKSKHTYIKKYYDIEILYLWETDILKNINVCKYLILEYINKNGILLNYQSFNYIINNNNNIILNKEIIEPYFLST